MLFCLFACIICSAQSHYNVNTNNGLSANYVYYAIKDRHGYLWLATTNGISKYNGYTVKRFGISDGIENEDTWFLFEDKQDRIWLSGISSQIGYIKNDKYRKAFVRNGDVLFPTYMRSDSSGIVFLSYADNKYICKFCKEKNDTVDCHNIKFRKEPQFAHTFINKDGQLTGVLDNTLYTIGIRNDINKYTRRCDIPGKKLAGRTLWLLGNHIVAFNTHNAMIIDQADCSVKNFDLLDNEFIYTGFAVENLFYLITNRNVYKFSTTADLITTYSYEQLIHDKNFIGNINCILEDNFWGRCIGTNENGLYIDRDSNYFEPAPHPHLTGYSFVNSSNNIHYWWNKNRKQLIGRNSLGAISATYHLNLSNINKVISYDSTHIILLANNNRIEGIYLLRTGNRHIKDFTGSFNNAGEEELTTTDWPILDAITYDSNHIYTVSRYASSGFGVFAIRDGKLHHQTIAPRKYASLVYDTVRNAIWAYSTKEIAIYNTKTQSIQLIDESLLESIGIKKIQKITIDGKYANIFIKSQNELYHLDPSKHTVKKLFSNYQLGNAIQYIFNNTLFIAAEAGIVFSKITGPSTCSKPYIYPNIKNSVYNHVYDIQPSQKNILLNTDNGFYTVTVPSDTVLLSGKRQKENYKLLLYYKDSIINTHNSDTILIDQDQPNLIFDVINPGGYGSLKYARYLAGYDTAHVELNTNNTVLPSLKAKGYYTLSVWLYDDVWKSDRIDICLYIKPYWWQTNGGKILISLGIILLTLLFIGLVFHITKRLVSRKHLKENMQLELKNLKLTLELKSIYSQINPHFIFNTLSTGLYFIKKKEVNKAYEHISSFSHLLRSYIKSSRNRYITIAEETENLENYIQLQQARFEDKFDYRIIIGKNIDAGKDLIPSLLLQPLVENAITHGLFHKEAKGSLLISFKKEENIITCTIDDDGVGREHAKEYTGNNGIEKQSYGTELIADLVTIFNTYEETKIDIAYIDKEQPDTGTTVRITINKST